MMVALQQVKVHTSKSVQTGDQARLHLAISEAPSDPEWDAFLERTPGGHHVQTSLWAQLKAQLGWQAVRILARKNNEIVGGVQMLIRSYGPLGAVGHVPKGPVVTTGEPGLAQRIVTELQELAKKSGVRYLHVQPPNNGMDMVQLLQDQGFFPSVAKSMLPTTVLVNLRPDADDILAQMRKKTRYGIRRSAKDGIVVRSGSAQDLPIFHQLLLATGERQEFSPFAEDYFQAMWQIFHPPGYLKLLISEYEGEAVSAQLVMAFGDTATAKQFGWSGQHGVHRPNEALDWATILWAKERGCRYYDLEGIDPVAADAILAGEGLPEQFSQTPTSYKLGFGGEVVRFPDAYELINNPVLRVSYQTVFPGLPAIRW